MNNELYYHRVRQFVLNWIISVALMYSWNSVGIFNVVFNAGNSGMYQFQGR